MTSGYKVSLWKPGGPGPIPHPSVQPEDWRKRLNRVGERASEGKNNWKERAKGRMFWMGVRKMKRGKRGVSQNVRERKRVSGWGSEALVGWCWLGARAECLVWKQSEQCAAAKPEIQLYRKRAPFPPQICTLIFSPPPGSITPSITLSVLPPDCLS